jgi:PadR family transcriptional regulator, regulatory protein AphA
MSINHAILGMLSRSPLSGYDMKKLIQDSSFMHWSGNNNQIYKALVELLHNGYVTNEVHHQESSPSKKIYTITPEGLEELRRWMLTPPEPPEFRKSFLIQLAWAEHLKPAELDAMLTQYEDEIRMRIVLEKNKEQRASSSSGMSPKEERIRQLISENIQGSFKQELEWVIKVRQEIGSCHEEALEVYEVKEAGSVKYIEYASSEALIRTGQDALDLIAACWEHDVKRVLLHAHGLAEDFFKLGSGLAGEVLQKLINYQVRAALVIPDNLRLTGRLKELLAESNKGNSFRVFSTSEEALDWLTQG